MNNFKRFDVVLDFKQYCDGCMEFDVISLPTAREKFKIYCKNRKLCAQLWDRLSTIRNDPPDLMEQIAAICREKGISVDEAVEMFKKL